MQSIEKRVPSYSREAVEQRLAKLVKKARKVGAPEPVWRWSEPIEIPRWRAGYYFADVPMEEREPPDYFETEYVLTVEAEDVRLSGGWSLVGPRGAWLQRAHVEGIVKRWCYDCGNRRGYCSYFIPGTRKRVVLCGPCCRDRTQSDTIEMLAS